MAAQVQLVRRIDFSVGGDTGSLSLYGDTAGISIARGGWMPRVAADGAHSVEEVLTLTISGSSHDDLASNIQALDDMIRRVPNYSVDVSEDEIVWLRAQLANESSPREAMILRARGELGASVMGPPVSPGNFVREYKLALERTPWWEPKVYTSYTFGTSGGISTLGGIYEYGTVVGDVPARVGVMLFQGVNGGGGPLYEFWLGFRTNRFGTRGNFEPVWECEDGTGANSTTSGADATASDGNKMTCTFASEALLPRVTIKLDDVTANEADQRGSFIVLLRAKVGASTVGRARLLDSLSGASDWRTQSRVVIDSTSWYLYEMGTVDMPPVKNAYIPESFLQDYALRIEAERVSGSNDLDLDCLILIPKAEGAIHVSGGEVVFAPTFSEMAITVHPNGMVTGTSYVGSVQNAKADPSPIKFGIPVGAGRLVVAGQRLASSDKADLVNVQSWFFPRWRTLRGAE